MPLSNKQLFIYEFGAFSDIHNFALKMFLKHIGLDLNMLSPILSKLYAMILTGTIKKGCLRPGGRGEPKMDEIGQGKGDQAKVDVIPC